MASLEPSLLVTWDELTAVSAPAWTSKLGELGLSIKLTERAPFRMEDAERWVQSTDGIKVIAIEDTRVLWAGRVRSGVGLGKLLKFLDSAGIGLVDLSDPVIDTRRRPETLLEALLIDQRMRSGGTSSATTEWHARMVAEGRHTGRWPRCAPPCSHKVVRWGNEDGGHRLDPATKLPQDQCAFKPCGCKKYRPRNEKLMGKGPR